MRDAQGQNEETDPYLPSGEWEGFYCYNTNARQHKMSIDLSFKEGRVSGGGVDDIAAFTWQGSYDIQTYKVKMKKSYPTHSVFYRGDIDENGIWGIWELYHGDFGNLAVEIVDQVKAMFKDEMTGGFHIWPKKTGRNVNHMAISEEVESDILKELFEEVFNGIVLKVSSSALSHNFENR